MSMDASYHGGSNDTIVGQSGVGGLRYRRFSRRRPYRPAHETVHLTSIFGGKGGDKKLPSAQGSGPLKLQLHHQNCLLSANVALFSMLNQPDCG